MKYLLFQYAYPPPGFVNLGDYIQTIAVREALKQIGCNEKDFVFFDRDALSYYSGEECVCVMNGWFSHTLTWFPSSRITPVYFGSHLNHKILDYIAANGEVKDRLSCGVVGARDVYTKDFLLSQGIDSFYSGCLTLTLPKRKSKPPKYKPFIVDVPDNCYHLIPNSVKKNSVRVSQKSVGHYSGGHLHQALYYKKADDLLKTYQNEASIVITSALHCACPCLAMGIPVVFLWPNTHKLNECQRISLVGDFLPIYSMKNLRSACVDWAPQELDLEDIKFQMLHRLQAMINININEQGRNVGKQFINDRSDIVRHTNQVIFSEKIYKRILNKIISIKK